MEFEEHIEELRRLKAWARASERPELTAARRREGSMTARERVAALLDADSFVELDVFTRGIVGGWGRVTGREVCVWAEDGAGQSGRGVGRASAKVAKLLDLALKRGIPVLSLHDGGLGGVSGDGGGSGAWGEVFFRQVMASGVVPQISAVLGPCEGRGSLAPFLADFTLTVKGGGRLALSGGVSSAAHLLADHEAACLGAMRELLSYLPSNNLEDPPVVLTTDPVGREVGPLSELLASADGTGEVGAASAGRGPAYDVRRVIKAVFDDGRFYELMAEVAPGLVIGLARLGGRAVGVVGNDPQVAEGRLDAASATKATRFVRTCDAFNLPIMTFVDTAGWESGSSAAPVLPGGQAAKLLHAYCEASVPKLTLIIGRAYGVGYEVLGSKGTRADLCLAWPWARLAPETQVAGSDAQPARSLAAAAKRGLLDDVIEPADTRRCLAAALEACVFKREGRPPKKHGNIPL